MISFLVEGIAMSARYAVRRAAVGDAADVAACLSVLGYGSSVALTLERLAAMASSARDVIYVAHEGAGGALGVVGVHLTPLLHVKSPLARITALAVRDGVQGRGIGRALVEAAEAWAWAAGAARIELTSGDHRLAAHAFYREVGYSGGRLCG
jgi:GNAT superfamily N-acetyltransferase